MSLYDPQRAADRGDSRLPQTHPEDAAVDAYLRHHFRVEPPEELAAGQGESGQASEDEQFEAYMRTHFPGRA